MFWRLWWRAISMKRPQAALALGSLMVGAAITSMLLSLYGDVRRKMTEDFRSYGANVIVAPPSTRGAPGVEGGTLLEESTLEPLSQFTAQMPGTSGVQVLYGVVQVLTGSANSRLPGFEDVTAVGAELGALRRMNLGWRLSGEEVSADLPPGECAVGANLAGRLHLRVGESLRLRRIGAAVPDAANLPSYRIAAIFTTGASEDDQVFLSLAALQSLLDLQGKVTLVELAIPGETREVESAVRRLAALLPGLEVRPVRQILYSEGKVLGTIRWLLLSLTVLILVIITLCLMATMTAIVLERRKDIGVMKALGAPDLLLARLFMTEGAGLGLVGGVLGYGVGAVLARELGARLFGVALGLTAWTLPVVSGLTVALAVVAAQVPLRILRAIQPTVVLKGD